MQWRRDKTMLRISRIIGTLRAWPALDWLPPVVAVAAAVAGARLVELLHNKLFPNDPIPIGTLSGFWKVFAVFVLAVLIWSAWRARRTFVIEEFVDFTTGDAKTSPARGLSALLHAELNSIDDRYRKAEDDPGTHTVVASGEAFAPTLKSGDPSDFLRSAVTAESQLSVGPLRLPVGALMGLFGRFARGPRITGSLHRDGSNWILAAQITSSRGTRSWCVQGACGSDARPSSAMVANGHAATARGLGPLVEDLALQMYADVALRGCIRWPALGHFLKALAAYRDCLRVPKRQPLNFKRAERALIETQAEDNTFSLALFNLGVVYERSGKPIAAFRAFTDAQRRNPDLWQPYYALAIIHFKRAAPLPGGEERQRFVNDAIENCELAIERRPPLADMALAYNLKGAAEQSINDLTAALASLEYAVELAGKALREAERNAPARRSRQPYTLPSLRQNAARCVLSLALLHRHFWHRATAGSREERRSFRRADAAFRQAAELEPHAARTYIEWARLLYAADKPDQAVRKLERAERLGPMSPGEWALLAEARARQVTKGSVPVGQARACCMQVLDSLSAKADDLARIAKVCDSLTLSELAQEARDLAEFEAKYDSCSSNDNLPQLAQECSNYEEKNKYRQAVRLRCLLAFKSRARGYYGQAEKACSDAIKIAEENHLVDWVRQLCLRSELAKALSGQKRFDDALRQARTAVQEDPTSYYEREALGEIYLEMGEIEQARTAYEEAQFYAPNRLELYYQIAICYWRSALNQSNIERRNEDFRTGIRFLEEMLSIGDPWVPNWDSLHRWGNYYLARLHGELLEYASAMSYWSVVREWSDFGAIAKMYTANNYLNARLFDDALLSFQLARQDIETAIQSAKSEDERTALLQKCPEKEFGEERPMPLAAVFGWSLVGEALCHADRCVNLDGAAELVTQARKSCKALDSGSYWGKATEAACDDCEGWILVRRSLSEQAASLDKAIDLIQKALAVRPDPEWHYHLAAAYQCRRTVSVDDAERQRSYRLALLHAELAKEIDLRGVLTRRVEALVGEIEGGARHAAPASSLPRKGSRRAAASRAAH